MLTARSVQADVLLPAHRAQHRQCDPDGGRHGCELHLVEPLGFDLSEPKLRRAGLDYHDLASVTVHPSLAAAWEALSPAAGVSRSPRTRRTSFADIGYRPGDVLMFGPEPTGLDAATLADPHITAAGAHPDAGGPAVAESVQRRGGRGLRGVAAAGLPGARSEPTRCSSA